MSYEKMGIIIDLPKMQPAKVAYISAIVASLVNADLKQVRDLNRLIIKWTDPEERELISAVLKLAEKNNEIITADDVDGIQDNEINYT